MSTYNQTNVTNFLLEIPDANITKAFKLNIQSALIPGIRIPVTDAPSGSKGLGRASIPGSTFEMDPLIGRILVDEDMQAWIDLYTWMLSINNYITLENEGWKQGVLPQFITLHILDNSKTNIVCSYHFHGAWPSDVSEVEFNYTEESDIAINCIATFQYKYFEVEKNGVIINTRQAITDKLNNGDFD